MREIKFRGLDSILGIWRYGWLCLRNKNTSIGWEDEENYCLYGVKPETVGQYIGNYDDSGKEIFEKDIVLIRLINDKLIKCKVFFTNRDCSFIFQDIEDDGGEYNIDEPVSVNVIGNIHQNPELLQENV